MNLSVLKESVNFLNLLFDNVTSAVYLVNQEARVVAFNDAFEALFQKSDDKILGELCGNVIGCMYAVEENKDCGTTRNCSQCSLRNSILKAATEKIPTYKDLLVRDFYINNLKITKYFQFTTKDLEFQNETLILVILDDITALKMSELQLQEKNQKLAEYNKQLNYMMSVVAHDLRNPLGAIRSFAQLFSQSCDQFDDAERQDIFKTIVNGTNSCLNMLDDLLDYSRFEAGKIEFKIDRHDYLSVINHVVNINSILAKNKNINIIKEFEFKELELMIDPSRMEQVIGNLLSNAIKYSPKGTEIKVIIRRENGWIKTEVIDQGPGITAEDQKELFKPFRRANVRTTGGESSTGLGLAIARNIINHHGGKIGVESEVGKGSNFYFYLPLKPIKESDGN